MRAGSTSPVALLALAALAALALGWPASARAQIACGDPDADATIADFRDRVLASNGLARFATNELGLPEACEYEVTTEFDGVEYGRLRLSYSDSVTLTVASWPPETTVITLESVSGFADAEGVEAALRAYTEELGFSIDWSTPELSVEGGESTTIYWDPEPGLNASASLTRSGGSLVEARVSWAL